MHIDKCTLLQIYMKALRNRQQLLSRSQVHAGTATSSDAVTETWLEVEVEIANYCLSA